MPLISLALFERLTPTFIASGFGLDLQNDSYCWEPIYSSPVTFLQLPGSLPVTNSDLPTPVPVNALPFNVLYFPTFSWDLPLGLVSEPRYWSPVNWWPDPDSSPVTSADLPGKDPDTFNPSAVLLCLTFEGFLGTSPQYSFDWFAELYSVPVTFLQVPGSSPVTFSDLPTSLPVTLFPADVEVTEDLVGCLYSGWFWQNWLSTSDPKYCVPVTLLHVLASLPVVFNDLLACVPVTVCPELVSLLPTFQLASAIFIFDPFLFGPHGLHLPFPFFEVAPVLLLNSLTLWDISLLDKSGSPLLAKDAALLFCLEADLPCLDCASLLAKTISLLVLVIGFLFWVTLLLILVFRTLFSELPEFDKSGFLSGVILISFTWIFLLASVRVLSDELMADLPWVDIAFLLSITSSLLDKFLEKDFLFIFAVGICFFAVFVLFVSMEDFVPEICISSDVRTLSLVVEELATAFFPLSLIAFLLSNAISLLVFIDITFNCETF